MSMIWFEMQRRSLPFSCYYTMSWYLDFSAIERQQRNWCGRSQDRSELFLKLQYVHLHACIIRKWERCMSRLDRVNIPCYTWETRPNKEGWGVLCRGALWGLQIGFLRHSPLPATRNTFSLSESSWHPGSRLPFSVTPRCGISPAGCATSSWKRRRSSKKETAETWRRWRQRSGRRWRRRPDHTWPTLRR